MAGFSEVEPSGLLLVIHAVTLIRQKEIEK
jgi:hypothetical protein